MGFLEEWRMVWRRRRTWLALLAAIMIGIIFSLVLAQQPNTMQEEKRGELNQLQAVLNSYGDNVNDPRVGEDPLYQLLLTQETLLRRQNQNLIMEDLESFRQVDYELRLNEQKLWQQEGQLTSTFFLPPKYQVTQNVLVDKTLIQGAHRVELNSRSAARAGYDWLIYITLGFFILIVFSAQGNLLEEFQHETILRGFPSSLYRRLSGQLLVRTLCALGLILLSWLSVAGSMALINGWGDFTYPTALPWQNHFVILPRWQFLLILLGVFLLVGFLVNQLVALINSYTRNGAVTVILLLGLYFSAFVWQATLWPGTWFQLDKIMTGAYFDGHPLGLEHFVVYWCVLIIALQAWLFIRLQKATLYRRSA
ncbi:hypothetical protein RU97_GL000149 [Enterococcus canis]|uniref:ABC transporter permease n=1 Tax=Enterococcus canis TaxID=214095 RepID=A0A1L8RJI0_9ENTE|nr:hypothetical protein [Enterococcus canis]OJG19916.1 hypothetical protein RU97_GL000149 [Enterococcus canis]